MASPKATRAAPTRIFENYVLTYVVGKNVGLSHVPDKSFTRVQEVVDGATGTSDFIPIGFDFVFDQIRYDKCVVSSNGYVVLVDPASSLNNFQTAQAMFNGGNDENFHIKLNNSTNSVLLCPWFDGMDSVWDDVTRSGGSASSEFKVNHGIETPSPIVNHATFGLRKTNDNSPEGRRFIIRWHSLAGGVGSTSVIAFECILYENGTIEFRYDKRQNVGIDDPLTGEGEDATIGVFGRGTNRFRDFAFSLGKTQNRQEYKYGGAVFNTGFIDQITETFPTSSVVSASYTISLHSQANWPGQMETGAVFRFVAPLNRAKILPKKVIQELDSYDDFDLFFDDRRTPEIVSGVLVNYPTTLPRFFGNSEANVSNRQQFFNGSSNELELTGSIVKSAIDQFITKSPIDHQKPFNESMVFDQQAAFFVSGSDIVAGHRLDQPLQSKTQIKFSLPVEYITNLFPTTASIYYYNARTKSWMLPRNTVRSVLEAPPFGSTDLALPSSFATNGRVIEDHKGFGPVGNLLGSGSNTPASTRGTDIVINVPYSTVTVLGQSVGAFEAMSRPLAKTFLVNPLYEATVDEVLNYPVLEYPFILEKAVFEIPFSAGAGWFDDKTTSFLPIVSNTGSFDFAGPGLTVALLNQLRVGSTTRRDLIMTGTITHSDDNVSTIQLTNFQPYSADFQLRPVGFRAYGLPSCVVSRPADSVVTGTLRVETEALISNGLTLRMSKDMLSSASDTNQQEIMSLVDQERILLKSSSADFSLGFNVAYVNGFGRSGTSAASPRSILGGEYVTSQGTVVEGTVKNPFHLTGSARAALASQVSATSRTRAVAAVSLETHIRSPYLIMPGDKLMLAIAKSRPHYFSNGLGGPEFSGSIAHDFQLMTGTVNVTLYGSYLREEEVVPAPPRRRTSNVIRDTIGNDPVLNEYNGHYRDEYVGGMLDDYVTGTLVTRGVAASQATTLVTGTRGRVFSKHSARSEAAPDSDSKSFQLQPWYERAGSNIADYIDSSERLYDSMMPNFTDAYKRDGTNIFVGSAGIFANTLKVEEAKVGRILLNEQRGAFSLLQGPVINGNWTYAFPFEPRYAGIARQPAIEKSFIAKKKFGAGGLSFDIEPTRLDGLIIGMVTMVTASANDEAGVRIKWFADVNTRFTNSAGFFQTSSLSTADSVKLLYGFGDLRAAGYDTFTGISSNGDNGPWRVGANYLPESRDVDAQDDATDRYSFSPIIRGWKYGAISGLPTYSRAYFRPNHYGQMRDMLEQRILTKFHGNKSTILSAPVQVRFVDSSGGSTRPENTQSQNLSTEATSSVPYFDGEIRNRTDLNPNTQNTNLVTLSADSFNNVAL